MKRKPNESFEDYKERRRITNESLKQRLKDKQIWDSGRQGTYRLPERQQKGEEDVK